MVKFYILLISCFFVNTTYAQAKLDVFDIGRKGTIDEAKELFKTNPEAFNTTNQDGFSPLILACYRSNNEVARFLIENGSNVNGTSNMGTALMAAVVKGNFEIAKLLLSKKADANIADTNGTTALIYATMFKNYDIVSLLIKAKANPDFKDNRGNSATDYAILANDDKLIEILKTK
ncbi:ankyrin repeat domain-containing protein [Flavobacterium sp. ZT3R17]|uniref:ankyrin repeat domain-containing protein n=1 Tax=Flavobacterium cryoconiti TaxID=3398736 RepID=UPI003A87A056